MIACKTIKSLLYALTYLNASSDAIAIAHITNDSRAVTHNTLFLAYPGEKSDGRQYILQAVAQGACVIVYDPQDDFVLPAIAVPCFPVVNLKVRQSTIAARFYDHSSQKIPVIGVTGTNGKTSITHFIAQAINMSDQHEKKNKCGIIGTIGYGFAPDLTKTINTTPDGLQLQKMFFEMVHDDATVIAMEVSSHALASQRVRDVQFHTAVFTNLTQDHLDFHHTMQNYRDAKELLFYQPGLKHALINIDDDAGRYFASRYREKLSLLTYSMHDKNADIYAVTCTPTTQGFQVRVKTHWGDTEFFCPLLGEFNVSNMLAVLGVLGVLQWPLETIVTRLSQLTTVNGRMQLLCANHSPRVIVDYAHTPDALEKVLQSVRKHCAGQLWCVFGCGGDRDKTKRPIMGAIADQFADHVIITNDNPRSEKPESIAQEILNGIHNHDHCYVELDRAKAIARAIHKATDNDWIVISGKGHETDQMMGNQVMHHSDSECVRHQLSRYA